MRALEFLAESRILNIGSGTDAVSNQCVPDDLREVEGLTQWVDQKLGRFIIQSYQGPALVDKTAALQNPSPQDTREYPWLPQALAAGEPIYYFDLKLDPALSAQIDRVFDWLRYVERSQPALFQRLSRVTWEQAVQHERKYHQLLANRGKKAAAKATAAPVLPGQEPVMQMGDLTWYRLTDEAALGQEGDLMGHCVGGYGRSVESGQKQIFSLRDADNHPHVTIEVAKENLGAYGRKEPWWVINQVKGKANDPPVPRYIPAVTAFINKMGIHVGNGGWDDLKQSGVLRDLESGRIGTITELGQRIGSDGPYEFWLFQPIPRTRKALNDEHWGEGRMIAQAAIVRNGQPVVTFPIEARINWPLNDPEASDDAIAAQISAYIQQIVPDGKIETLPDEKRAKFLNSTYSAFFKALRAKYRKLDANYRLTTETSLFYGITNRDGEYRTQEGLAAYTTEKIRNWDRKDDAIFGWLHDMLRTTFQIMTPEEVRAWLRTNMPGYGKIKVTPAIAEALKAHPEICLMGRAGKWYVYGEFKDGVLDDILEATGAEEFLYQITG